MGGDSHIEVEPEVYRLEARMVVAEPSVVPLSGLMHYLYLIKMNTQQPFHPTHPTNEPSLTKEQVEAAKDELVRDAERVPTHQRRFVDPHKPARSQV